MATRTSWLHLLLILLIIGVASSSYSSACSVDFEHMNYTVMTSQCKGPNYSVERCCAPLKQLLCPVKDQVNDLQSNCAETFFSYANLYGKYPPELFTSLCKESEKGLDCSNVEALPPTSPQSADAPLIPLLSFASIGISMLVLAIMW